MTLKTVILEMVSLTLSTEDRRNRYPYTWMYMSNICSLSDRNSMRLECSRHSVDAAPAVSNCLSFWVTSVCLIKNPKFYLKFKSRITDLTIFGYCSPKRLWFHTFLFFKNKIAVFYGNQCGNPTPPLQVSVLINKNFSYMRKQV